MPVNSFENYYMSWKPKKERIKSPVQNSLANYLERDIKNGKLTEHTKLPPQRELADFLDLSLTTVTRAYKICEKKGLIYGVMGKGTFVSPNINAPRNVLEFYDEDDDDIIEMGTTIPFYKHDKLIAGIAKEIICDPLSFKHFQYKSSDEKKHLIAGRNLLSTFNIDVSEDCIAITNGSQNALSIVLMSLFQSGDKIITDSYTYANFIGLANMLNITLIGVEINDDGINTDTLEYICRTNTIKGIFLMPSCNNPTNISMSLAKRKKVAEIIKKYDLILIEDASFAFLEKYQSRSKPIFSMAPDNSVYITSLSKSICPKIRIAYLAFAQRFKSKIEKGICNVNLISPSINKEIATKIISTDLYEKIVSEKKKLAYERNKIFYKCFPELADDKINRAFFQWITLPNHLNGADFELKLKKAGVQVYCSERFSVGNIKDKYAIRVAICSPKDDKELKKGLDILKSHMK